MPNNTWASLPTLFKAAVAASWSFILSSATDIDAQVSAHHRADIAAAEDALENVD